MDLDKETVKLNVLVFVALAFLISAYASCRDIKYELWGVTTEATITRTRKKITTRGRRVVHVLVVDYRFVEEDGTERNDDMSRELDWQAPSGNKLQIDYLPGAEGESRRHGKRNYIALVFFFGTLTAGVVFTGRLWRRAYE